MNGRFVQLAYEAKLFNGMPAPVKEVEKFAELIVKECAQVCLAQRDPANLNYKPSEKFAEAVKQHFGVEE
jgi:hypothetical protein